jgi:hypothetical protein
VAQAATYLADVDSAVCAQVVNILTIFEKVEISHSLDLFKTSTNSIGNFLHIH